MDIKPIIEALLFAADRPLSVRQLQELFPPLERPAKAAVLSALEAIGEDYRERPIELTEVASGYRFQVRQAMSPWLARLFEERPLKYSRALLETLAIIAYRQPVTRGEIEQIRGVSVSSSLIRNLLERDWVRIVGSKEIPGRPALYATTQQFLDYFNLKGLKDLPPLKAMDEGATGHDSTEIDGNEANSEQTSSAFPSQAGTG